jgi:4-hydroxybenzoate polyprenyltransferase
MLLQLLRKLFHLFVFSSVYIALCAVLMVYQTNQLLQLNYSIPPYLLFVFFSTICSYNFHWYLTSNVQTEAIRVKWTQRNKTLHLILFSIGFIGSVWYFFYFINHWFWLGGAVVLTYLYSAPKLTYRPFVYLRKIAIGKTIFLAFVWMYVTTFLPVIFSNKEWSIATTLFCINRFFLIYAICILFDYRDRLNDKKAGIRSMITYLDERGINRLFYISLFIFLISSCFLYNYGFSPLIISILLLPGGILLCLYKKARRNFSDYLYYVVLDGLMMLSALIILFLNL